MSISTSHSAAVTFILEAYTNVDAEVLILDGGLNAVARGVGSVSRQLPQGLYKVKSNRGGSTVEQLVELTRDRRDIFLGTSNFPAIAPIQQVLGNDWSAVESFGSAERKSGGDASILILAHADAESVPHNLLTGLRLFAWGGLADGERLGPIAVARTIGKRRWCVVGKVVEPGTHVLEITGGVRQAVLVVAGWETRVFIHRSRGATDKTRSGSFDVSIQMARPGDPVVYSDHLETLEVARNALASSRPIFVSPNLIDQLLGDKFGNPILGITGLHLFLQAVERDASPQARSVSLRLDTDVAGRQQDIVTEVLINLTALLTGGNRPMPPDLVALYARTGRVPETGIEISEPPMFWASWDAVRKAFGPGRNVTVERRLWSSIAYSAPSGPYLSWKRGRTSLSKYLQHVAPHLPWKAGMPGLEAATAEDDEEGVLNDGQGDAEGDKNNADSASDNGEAVNEGTTVATATAGTVSTSATLDLVGNSDLRILLGIPASVAQGMVIRDARLEKPDAPEIARFALALTMRDVAGRARQVSGDKSLTKSRLLVKVRGDGKAFAKAAAASFGASAVEIEPILHVPARKADSALGLAGAPKSTWLRVGVDTGDDNPWDHAHAMLGPGSGFALGGAGGIEAVEPDIEQAWPRYTPPAEPVGAALAAADICAFVDQDASGGRAVRAGEMGWNFDNAFSELAKARARFGDDLGDKLGRIVIAHLDTGYDPAHITRPERLRLDLQHSFVDGDPPYSAVDHTPPAMTFIRNRGHGTATLALLAGNRLDGTSPHWPGFIDFLGGAPLAQVIPIRIADWVVRFSVGTMVQGFDYARRHGAHVLSMSMGGVSSRALVDAINLAYEAGMVLVTAAGDNFAARPMPRTIVFPARYHRVLAACGVMADGRAYADLDPGTMQGSHGPPSKMPTALGAYTPNVPWAQIDCGKVVDMDGAGTSAATPQIAAAAALWLAEHFDAVSQYPKPWMRVEAVRRALFETAAKTTAQMNAAKTFETIGQGVLKADAALAFAPPAHTSLHMLPQAEASWSWLDMLNGSGVSLAPGEPLSEPRVSMLRLELTQMAQRVPEVEAAIADPGLPVEEIGGVARRRYLEAALDHGNPSRPLRHVLKSLLGRPAVSGGGTTGGPESP